MEPRADILAVGDRGPVRIRMYSFIQRHPATHILEVAAEFGFSHPTVMYHLRVLEDEGYVESLLWGKRRFHFDARARFTPWEREVLAILALDEARAILERIASRPGTYPRELARDLACSETTVKRYVPALLRLHALVEEQASFRRRLWVSPLFRRRAAALVEKLPADARGRDRLVALAQEGA